jgi:hypothetical protein
MLFALAALAAPTVSYAADATPIRGSRGPVSVAPPSGESTIIIEQPSPIRSAPAIRYGCSRIWRCDSVICEWRRGCWGVYGYMEGPYYTLDLAKRQWERHGWPTPNNYRDRYSFSK